MATRQGPGQLAPVHRITIITAFLGALGYLVWEINDVTTGTAAAVARCVAAAAFVVALGLYLRNSSTPPARSP